MTFARFQRRPATVLSVLGVTAAVGGGVFGLSKGVSGQILQLPAPPTVTDVTNCPVSTVTIARTPYNVRIEKQFTDGNSVITLDGIFAGVPQGTTFHVTHVNAMFFTDGSQESQVRLYKNGKIIEGFNMTDTGFHLQSSQIQSRTLNQPVDVYFPISADPGEYDLQLIRAS